MPERAGVDDDEQLKELLALWADADADLEARKAEVLRRIERLLKVEPVNREVLRRLRIQVDRLTDLGVVAQRVAEQLRDETTGWLEAGGIDRVYQAGAATSAAVTQVPFAFSVPHRAAADVLAADTFESVLSATQFVDAEAKVIIRRMGRVFSGRAVSSGQTAVQAARRLARELEGVGLATVTYRDGSRHRVSDYADMLIREKTAVAYNAGAANHGKLAGVEVFELLDGFDCGLTSHDDTLLAHQLLVPYEVAMAYPTAHPRCRRSVNARPDLTLSSIGQAGALSVQSPQARADQAAFEQALAIQNRQRAVRRQRRVRRARR